MTVGLGSGSTLANVVKHLGGVGTNAEFVVASSATRRLAEKFDLKLTNLKRNERLDLAIDGADEINPELVLLKGGGGAHTREKIVAGAADSFAIVVDRTKLVDRIGTKNPLPVEVIPFAHEYTAGLLEEHGEGAKLRTSDTGKTYVTDNGNHVIDLETGGIRDPGYLSREINRIPGVVENGIFTNAPDRVFVGHEGGCEKVVTGKGITEILEKSDF